MGKTSLKERCRFKTNRLAVYNSALIAPAFNDQLARRVVEILSPAVTQSLPEGWQNIATAEQALTWLEARQAESVCLVIEHIETTAIIGFIFLYEVNPAQEKENIRFGYLLRQEVWGQGFGTEVMQGFIAWCQQDGHMASIAGGVEKVNIGSIKVLEKTGFKPVPEEENETTAFYAYHFA